MAGRNTKSRKKARYMYIISIAILIIVAFLVYSKLTNVWVQREFAESLKEVGGMMPTGAVILSNPSHEEVVDYYAKQTTYLKPDDAGWEKAAIVYLSPELPNVKGNNLYIMVTLYDLRTVEKLNLYKQIGDIRPPVVVGNSLVLSLEEEGLSYQYTDEETGAIILLDNNDEGYLQSAKVIYEDGEEVSPMYLIDEEGSTLLDEEGSGCLYQGQYIMYFDENLCNTLLVKMLVGQEIDGLEMVYDQPWMKLYKVI